MSLIERLRNGEVTVKNDGSLKELNRVLKAAFPDDRPANSFDYKNDHFYSIDSRNWIFNRSLEVGIEVISVEQFIAELDQPKLKTGDKVWVSDESEEHARSKKDEYTYLCFADGRHWVKCNIENDAAYSWDYVVPASNKVTVSLEEIADWKGVDVKNLRIKG